MRARIGINAAEGLCETLEPNSTISRTPTNISSIKNLFLGTRRHGGISVHRDVDDDENFRQGDVEVSESRDDRVL
ncbi:hypothetical protein BTUL_0250g00020 [Botrytis tulipae]|uniref:Uncharacterized protein n=1 Tax=Botrytis tulipae TaxID=87230 RepID=A0A4Z1EEC6_9HELO|nr:hypothetical protein BTUL_0250g00020 [Botrytis tulipae]